MPGKIGNIVDNGLRLEGEFVGHNLMKGVQWLGWIDLYLIF